MVRYSKKHSMDPSITSKTTILFDVTTILFKFITTTTFLAMKIRMYTIDRVVLLSPTVIVFFKHERQKMTFKSWWYNNK
jgi:hypothetical protein